MTFNIGKIAQVAFVVNDLEAKMSAFWTDFGIGPWSVYTFAPPRVKDMTYRGKRQEFSMRVAFAMCGETQIELVQSISGPNVYEEFLGQCGEGVQHLGVHVTDMQAAASSMQQLGYELVQSGRGYGVQGDGEFRYFATADRIGTLIELIQLPRERYPPDRVYPA
ncbi:MAG: VOC family protein [Chloroflexi bacterium]|nr:VOC family protein [Chloroflexota bacterium]MBV9544896.1 VOC family protein [Chloroflexota bacterium]